MATKENFSNIFDRLKTIFQPYESQLVKTIDQPEGYSLNTNKPGPFNNQPMFFGAVQTKKNYVSVYLMPVYVYPDLLNEISPELKKRMQGKSCFNFKKIEEDRFQELAGLVSDGLARFKQNDLA